MGKSNQKSHNLSNGLDKDKRFSKITSDPLFREILTKERKITVDERFQLMFEDDRFKIGGAKVDKRGRKFNLHNNDHLSALYDVEKSDEESGTENEQEEIDLPINVDLARGEGNVSSSSSSDESDTSDDEQDEELEKLTTDDWGEMDCDVKRVEWISRRVAICNLEWDRLSADDILVVLNSFKPTSGVIKSVSIYLSDFGAQRIEEENKSGPQLNQKVCNEATIRAYQLDRLRYYYALCECDTAETAASLYENCDGVEYETSGVRFDVRFVPDDMEFDESRLKERTNSIVAENYKPKRFESNVLSNAKAKLMWDETDPERSRSMHNAFKDENLNQHYQQLIAPPSDSEDDEETKRKRLELLLNADDLDERPTPEEELRIDWDVPVTKEEKAGSSAGRVVKASVADDDDDDESATTSNKKGSKKTPFQEYLARRKEKRRERKALLREKKLQWKQEAEELQEQAKKKTQKRRKPDVGKPSSNTLDLGDSRFAALFTDSTFAIDKTNVLYRGGGLAEQQAEKRSAKRRRPNKDELNNNVPAPAPAAVAETHEAMEITETMVNRLKRKMMKGKC